MVLFFMSTPKKAACLSAPHALVKSIAKKPKSYYVNIHTTAFPAGAIRGQLGRA